VKRRLTIYFAAILTALMLLSSCNDREKSREELKAEEQALLDQYLVDHNVTVDPLEPGLYYIPVREGTGVQPVDTNWWIEVGYTGELIDGTVFATSYDSVARGHGIYEESYIYGPRRMRIGRITLEGLNKGIPEMKVGGTGVFILRSDWAWGVYSSELIPSYSTLIYTIDLLAAFDDPRTYETGLIQQYLADSNFTVDSTETGLHYIEQIPGAGDFIEGGDYVDVWYTGYFLDGRQFDSNIGGIVYHLKLGETQLIEGWNEGLRLMRKGSKGILIVPYWLAYGEEGFIDSQGWTWIPPYMTLVFEIEIVNVT
jgi:FKBP-type peptidyl-prolyl cis-trans isomerase